MAPAPKRKRGDRNYSYDDNHSGRPSPHRPQDLALASPQQQMNSPRGGRRGNRNGGRGGYSGAHNSSGPHASPTAMSPPANAYQASRPAPSTPSHPPAPPKEPAFQPASRDVPDSNEHLTPDRVANWSVEARNAVVQAAITAQREGDMFNLNIVFLEIVDASVQELMSPAELGSMVRDIVSAPADELIDPVACFLDSMSSYTWDHTQHASLQKMLVATGIEPDRMRRELDEKLLIGLDLVRPIFSKVGVRKATKVLYQQMNYNLLREETEGFSKLMTEYFTTANSQPPRHHVVSATFKRVNAIIGTFDLHVGRVLDVTLDVFANLLVKHNKFFIKYLRVSTWWPKLLGTDNVEWQEPEVQTLPNWALPTSEVWYYTDEQKAEQLRLRESRDVKFWHRMTEIIARKGEKSAIQAFFELGARPITRTREDADKSDAEDTKAVETAAEVWADEWTAETGTLPPLGNEIAAQLLGFKLQFYASDSRDAHDVLPDNLIYLAALLIKIGFISITDLWEHLYPQHKDMEAHRLKLREELEEKEKKAKGQTSNALTTAGALSDDTHSVPAVARLREAESKPSSKQESERSTPAKSEEGSKPKLPEPADQKVALLRSLLCIGALPEALFILGRYRWFLDVYPDLHAYIFRLAHHSLSKVYESSRPVPLDKVPVTTKGTCRSSTARASDYAPRRTLRWAKPDLKDAGDGTDYKFYWEDWVDNVPICQSVDDVFLLCNSLLGFVGPECGRDTMLITKLARIGKKSVIEDPSKENMKRWSDLSATFLAPALTFTGQNPGVVNEMWELIRRFDTATRYAIYHQWFNMPKQATRKAFMDVKAATKYILGRVASTNTRPMGRAMAKLAYACPGTVFELTLKQGQQFPNMIEALVECSRYLTHLGYDCLTWSLVTSISSTNRSTTQDDGMLMKGWLKNTAVFVGKVYQRYSLMDPSAILEFVNFQLLCPDGELFMMKVLEELISSMGGVSLSGALKEANVVALSAGPRLRTYTLEHLGDRRHKAKTSARRLLRYLKDADLAPPMLIALARQVQTYLYREDQRKVPDKVVFTNFDNLKLNFIQFHEYLRENLSVEEFDEQIPSLVELMSDYYLDTELAFHIARDSIALRANAARLQYRQIIEGTSTNGDVSNKGTPDAGRSSNIPKDATNTAAGDVEMENTSTTGAENAAIPDSGNESPANGNVQEAAIATRRPNPEIDTLVSKLQSALPTEFGGHPCLSFLVTFWELSLTDVYPPDGEMLKQQYADAKQRIVSNATNLPNDRRKDFSVYRQAREDADKLTEEYGEVTKRAQLIQSSLQEEMHFWFPGIAIQDQTLHMTLLQDCFLPRARMSLHDAQFSSGMLFFMHNSGVPKFRLIKILDELFAPGRLSALIFSISEDESKNFGRFLNDILQELGRWHSGENIYNNVALGKDRKLPSFGRQFDADGLPTTFVTYSDYRLVLGKWHKKLHDALHDCMQKGEHTGKYTELRNSINILKAVAPSFPTVREHATRLRAVIEGYANHDDEERQDIQVAASSLLYEFKRSANRWKSNSMFTTGKEDPKEATPGPTAPSRTNSGPPKTSEIQDNAAQKLSATAPTFEPKISETNGVTKSMPEKSASDERKPPATTSDTATSVPRVNGKDAIKPPPRVPESTAPHQFQGREPPKRLGPGPSLPSANSTPVPPRPDSRGGYQAQQSSRLAHGLPSRPDGLPPRTRQPERPGDRPAEYAPSHGRHDARTSTPNDYGRLERVGGPPRDRSASPGRHSRPRSQDRVAGIGDRSEWPGREIREYDDRSLRGPPRDVRGPPNRGMQYGDSRDYRDGHDQRDYRQRDPMRERTDSRGPLQLPNTPIDSRNRLHNGPALAPNDPPPHRRDNPGALPPRPSITTGPPNTDRPNINPERAAYINEDRINPERAAYMKDDRVNTERAAYLPEDRGRNSAPRVDREAHSSRHPFAKEERPRHPGSRPDRDNRIDDRDIRRERPQSPRRDDRPSAPPYHGVDTRRDYRDDRSLQQPYPTIRERREEPADIAPTGPRGGRDVPAPTSSRVSREMFQPSQTARPIAPTQDPNYGRLNQPAETIPSGPKYPSSDRRDVPAHPPAPTLPAAPAPPQPAGVHPSRMNNIQGRPGPPGPPLQTDISNVPSGPRGSGRTPLPSPSSRGPPTGPASTERNARRQDSRTALGAINNVLAQTQAQNASQVSTPPTERPTERSHRRRERSRSGERKPDDRSRDKRESSRRDREPRESSHSHRERSDRSRDDRSRKDERERDRSEKKRSRDPMDQPHGDSKRSRR